MPHQIEVMVRWYSCKNIWKGLIKMGWVGSEASTECSLLFFFCILNGQLSTDGRGWERKATFTKIHFLVSFHALIQESLLSCLISRLVPNKDFLLYLVNWSLSGYMVAHHPDTFQDQGTPLVWLHGSFSQYLSETLAEITQIIWAAHFHLLAWRCPA